MPRRRGRRRLRRRYFFAPWCATARLSNRGSSASSASFLVGEILPGGLQGVHRPRVRAASLLISSVHLYLPGVGRRARSVLTGPTTEAKLRPLLERFGGGGPQRQLLEAVAAAALAPVVRYTELVGALRSLAELGSATTESAGPPKPSLSGARLRSIIEGDEQRLAELEELFTSLDADADGRLRLGELEAALEHLPSGVASVGDVVQRLGDSDTSLSVDKPTFVSLMVERAVADFGAGEARSCPRSRRSTPTAAARSRSSSSSARWTSCARRGPRPRAARWTTASSDWGWRTTPSPTTRSCSTTSASSRWSPAGAAAPTTAPSTTVRRRRLPTSAYLKEEAENMGERECFGAAVDEAGEDIACDAWFYGEDPTVEKAAVAVDAARLEALKGRARRGGGAAAARGGGGGVSSRSV